MGTRYFLDLISLAHIRADGVDQWFTLKGSRNIGGEPYFIACDRESGAQEFKVVLDDRVNPYKIWGWSPPFVLRDGQPIGFLVPLDGSDDGDQSWPLDRLHVPNDMCGNHRV